MARACRDNLQALNLNNVSVVEAPPEQGYKASAPYDVILLDGAASSIPRAVSDQLAEGGRLVAVLRRSGAATALPACLFPPDPALGDAPRAGSKPLDSPAHGAI